MKRNKFIYWVFSSLMIFSLVSCSRLNDLLNASSDGESNNYSSDISSKDSSSTNNNNGEGTFTIFSINDFHGKIKKTAQYPGILADQGAILNNPKYTDESVILSAGDMWQGSYISGFDEGLSTTKLMNDFPFKAMVLGNHEFDWGIPNILKNQKEASFPFLCANLIEDSTNKRPEKIKDHVTLTIDDSFKLGVVGAIGANLESSIKSSMIEGYSFSDNLDLLKTAIDECKNEGADSVILLLHDDMDSSYTNSIQASSLDFQGIFGGHSHQLQKENSKIPYVQGSSDSRAYSYMTIDKSSGEVTDLNYVSVDDSFDQFATMDFTKEVNDLIDSRPSPTLGKTVGTWTKEATMNFVVKAMFEMTKKTRPDKNYTESDLVAAHNKSGIRGTFVSSNSPRNITMEDIQTISPFSNEVMLLPNRLVNSYELQTGSYNVTYPDSSSWSNKRTMDIVTIDFLVSDRYRDAFSPTSPEPAQKLKTNGESYVIYDLLSDYVSSFDGTPINAADYR